MPVQPRPTPSVILVDPGDSPIVTGSQYYYQASTYSCNRTVCGQFLGNTTIFSGATPLVTGRFYISPANPGFVYQPVSTVTAVNGLAVNTTAYSSCGAACTVTNAFPSLIPSSTPSVTVTPSITPSTTVGISVSPTPTISVTATPSRTPSVTPSITPTITPTISTTPSISPTISITPTISVTPSVTPFPSPQVGMYITCSWQILNTIPTSSNSVLVGSTTGSLSASVSSSGIFIPTASGYQTTFPAGVYWDPIFYFSLNFYDLQPPYTSHVINPSTLAVANGDTLTRVLYVNRPNFWNNVKVNYSWVQNRAGTNDNSLRDYNLRVRVYKNGYLIYDNVSPQSGTTYSYPPILGFNYGTMCDGDDVKIVYSLA